MGRLLSALKAGVANFGAKMGSMLKGIPGAGIVMSGWQSLMDSYDWCMDQVEAAWDFTVNAAVHVSQDVAAATRKYAPEVSEGVREGLGFTKRVVLNNPVSNMLKNAVQVLTGDHRPRIQANPVSKADSKNAVDAVKSANPAELAKLRTAYIKNDPEQVERYVGAENKAQKEAAFKAMSPKCQAWVSELKPTDLWSLKGKSAVEIAAHMAGDKAIAGVEKVADYYHLAKVSEAAPAPKADAPRDKTVSERRAERTAAKLAKRDAANGITPEVAGTVQGQSAEVAPTAQQEVMNFFGPKVAKPEEVSEYSQAALPAYRPPVPMQRKAMA